MTTFWRLLDSYATPYGDAVVVAILMAIAAAAALVAVAGRADPSRPRCRRCLSDARPYAWSDEKRCTCGGDLARPGGVRVARRRGRRSRVVAIAAATLAIGVASIGTWFVSSGRSWLALLPFRVLTGGMNASSELAHAAMGSLVRTMDGDGARDAITYLHETPTARISKRETNVALLARLLDLGADSRRRADASRRAQSWALQEICVVAVGGGSQDQTASPLQLAILAPLRWSWFVRIRELRAGEAVLWREPSPTGSSTPSAMWHFLSPMDVEELVTIPQETLRDDRPLSVVLEFARLTLANDTVTTMMSSGGPTPDELLAGYGAERFTVTMSPSLRPLTFGMFGSMLMQEALTDEVPNPPVRVAAVPFVSAAVGGVSAGLSLAAIVLFGIGATRHSFAMVAPTCRRCRSQLRSHGSSIPERCPECGAALHADGSVRWARRRRSAFGRLVVVPAVVGVAAALAIALGIVIGTKSLPVVARSLVRPQRLTDIAIAEALSDDPTLRLAAATRLSTWSRQGYFDELPRYDEFEPNGSIRALARSLLGLLDDPHAPPPRDRDAQSALVDAVAAAAKTDLLSPLDRVTLLKRVSDPPIAIALEAVRPGERALIILGTSRYTVAGQERIRVWSPRTDSEDAHWVSSEVFHRVTVPTVPGVRVATIELRTRRDIFGDNDEDLRLAPPADDGPTPQGLVETVTVPILVMPEGDPTPITEKMLQALDPIAPFLPAALVRWRRLGTFAEVTLDLSERTGTNQLRELRREWQIWDGTMWRRVGGTAFVLWPTADEAPASLRLRHVSLPVSEVPAQTPELLFEALSNAPPRECVFEKTGTLRSPDGTFVTEYRPPRVPTP
ncbi:MAG: hypothetical protein JNM94_11195 [Phycisphaerae bacterium]|nr:hypothetical protein [Phycisphaerae bacterium]